MEKNNNSRILELKMKCFSKREIQKIREFLEEKYVVVKTSPFLPEKETGKLFVYVTAIPKKEVIGE